MPSQYCEQNTDLKNYGFYRRLNGGKIEFISICNPEISKWLSIHERDFEELLKKYNIEDDTILK